MHTARPQREQVEGLTPREERCRPMQADPALSTAAVAFAGAAAFGSVVSLVHDVPGEPLGVPVPLSVTSGLLVGWGAGVAAPWPMPVAALAAAAATRNPGRRRGPGLVGMGLGLACIAGTLVEPVTYRRRPWARGVAAAIAVNLVTSAALAAAGRRMISRR